MIFIVGDPLVSAHLAVAVTKYKAELRRNGRRAPDELDALLEALSASLRGQERPILAPEPLPRDPLLMDYSEAADVLRVSARTVRRLVAEGKLPPVRIGGRSLIRVADVESFVSGGNSDAA